MTRLSVVIASSNTRSQLGTCLSALERGLPVSSEVIVVDNGSVDGSVRMVKQDFPFVRLVRNPNNRGYAAAVNQGIERASGDYVLLLDSDAAVEPTAIKRMVAFLERSERHGAVAPRLLNSDGSTQRGHLRFPSFWTPLFVGTPLESLWPDNLAAQRYHAEDLDYEREQDVEQPPASCLLLRRTAFRKREALDEDLPLFFADVELCQRLWASGWRIRYLPDAHVAHQLGATMKQLADPLGEWHRNRLVYYRKRFGRWGGYWIKACVAFTFAGHLVRELYQRAEGLAHEPLTPVFRGFAVFIRA